MKKTLIFLFPVLLSMVSFQWQTNHVSSTVTARDLSNTSWTYNYEGGFSYGVVQLQYVEDTIIQNSVFSKFDRCYTSVVSGNDTLRGKDAPMFLREDESVLYVSYNGVTADTLHYFAGVPDDSWVYDFTNSAGEQLFLQATVLDTFTRQYGGRLFSGQLVEYDYLNGLRPFTDTVIAGVGTLEVYIDPFEFLIPTVEGERGGVLRCFSDASIAIPFNNDEVQIYAVDCLPETTNATQAYIGNEASIKLVGNPVQNELLISCPFTNPINAVIYAANGAVVDKFQLFYGENLYDCTQWLPGLYMIATESGEVLRVVK